MAFRAIALAIVLVMVSSLEAAVASLREDLLASVRSCNVEAAKALILRGASVNVRDRGGWSLLHLAARCGSADLVNLLLAHGADATVSDYLGVTPLDIAVGAGDSDAAQALIESGADVNSRRKSGRTPLHSAAGKGDARMVRVHLAAGADVNARMDSGRTPLHCAARKGDARTLRLLLAAGAEIDARKETDGTALHDAARSGDAESVKVLLAAGADVHAKEKCGTTVLHGAVWKGDMETTKVLLAAGADVNAKDNQGLTPLKWALIPGRGDLIPLLRMYAPVAHANRGTRPRLPPSMIGEYQKLSEKTINVFSLETYPKLVRAHENLVFSPFGAFCPLVLAHAGAGGRTKEEIARALALPHDSLPLHDVFAGLIRYVKESVRFDGGEFESANGIWIDNSSDYRVRDEFRKVAAFYGTLIRETNHRTSPAKVAQEINRWVAQSTHGRIQRLTSGQEVAECELAMVNAVYFKSAWAIPFKRTATKNRQFKLHDGSHVMVPMMSNHSFQYTYAEDRNMQAVEIPCQGRSQAMVLFIPKTNDGLSKFEKGLDPAVFTAWLGRLSTWPAGVEVWLPRFSVRSSLALVPALKAMGVTTAFDSHADFPGFFDHDGKRAAHDLFIQDLRQEAWVAVNEEGTEGSAATGAIFSNDASPPKPKVFKADHPFMFVIYDKLSHCILFMGRLMNPEAPAR